MISEKEYREEKEEFKKKYREEQFYRQSIILINDFINNTLNGEIERLKTYYFDDLKGNLKYSYPKCENISGWIFDCDDTVLARAIYCVIWGYIFELKVDNIGPWNKKTGKKIYRGDTMNSFNTLFGNSNSGIFAYRARFYGLDEDIAIWQNIIRFRYKYHTIGNFIVIPNKGNINGVRGRKLKDYFDLFLLDIYEYKKNNVCKLKEQFDKNSFYKDFSMNSIKEIFFLEDYFKGEIPKEFINTSKDARYKITRSKEERIKREKSKGKIDYFLEEEYKKLVHSYLAKSEQVIDNRADKIIKILKDELEVSLKIGIL
ncbi:MAG TPA: hypothetical protein DDY58_19570 [Terrisporobacter glycolicus]|uniref:hypothetical protein n=1 Tax=Terrisporobacter TaxID=1505652 RepID=UPI000E9341DF|nr:MULTISPECIES: hypothetical protein [Terrisporobacter]HBI94446.1 hypothetical protein [Terrisporobacter hibernicus]